ncbi:MAG: helix-turn-helix domain-containing protein [Candidatus Heimdallarchaeota archaeon]
MKKNPRLQERRKSIPKDVDIFINRSFKIVDRIHEILIDKNLDQKDLAELLGKKESEISKWMTGTHNFTLKTISRIENALGMPVMKVVSKEDYKRQQPLLIVMKPEDFTHINSGKRNINVDKEELTIYDQFVKTVPNLS